MSLLKHIEEISIPSECASTYEGMAFDGCHYYFLMPCMCKIIKTTTCFTHTECYETRRNYNCICYDYKEHCFWAASKNCHNKILKLDCNLREIDCITFSNCEQSTGVITGISYNCCEDTLLIAFTGSIAELNKATHHIKTKYNCRDTWITGVLSICPGYIFTAIKENKQCVYILDYDDRLINSYIVKDCNILKSMILNPCSKKCDKFVIDCLTIKNGCYPYIIKTKIDPCSLGFYPCLCNKNICEKCCDDHKDNHDACTDVIKSIALVETALSHILNAEGEKLQKIIASTNDIDKILCANKEVNKTIINATHLEHALYAKLSAVLECCKYDDTCDHDCDCCNDCCM